MDNGMFGGSSGFGGAFDFNHDGRLSGLERAAAMSYFDQSSGYRHAL